MSTMDILVLVVGVGTALSMAGAGLWAVRTRRRAWEEHRRKCDTNGLG